MTDHLPKCPCNNADDRGCFLISAETGKCVSCRCDHIAKDYQELHDELEFQSLREDTP